MARKFAGVMGIVFILVAVLGFLMPGGMSMEADPARAPHVLGLFPVNLLHNIVHLLFGLWGLAASRSLAATRTYGRVGAAIYLVLAILGFIAPSGFGLVPLGGHDIWLHLVLAAGLAYIGFKASGDPAHPGTGSPAAV